MTLLELEAHLAFLRKANYADDNTKLYVGVNLQDETGKIRTSFMEPLALKKDGTIILIPVR